MVSEDVKRGLKYWCANFEGAVRAVKCSFSNFREHLKIFLEQTDDFREYIEDSRALKEMEPIPDMLSDSDLDISDLITRVDIYFEYLNKIQDALKNKIEDLGGFEGEWRN